MALFPITKQDVLDFAPQLSVVSVVAWVTVIEYCNEIDLTSFGCTDSETTLARIYMAAHIGTLMKQAGTGAAGPVTSEAVGGVRRSYGLIASATSDAGLTSTRFGQLYYDLLFSTPVGLPMLL